MLRITKRDCHLGLKVKGDADDAEDGNGKTRIGLQLEEIMLEAHELNALLGEPHAANVLFNHGKNPIEPYLQLQLRVGGLTALSCAIEGEPALAETLTKLIEKLGHEIEVEIHVERKAARRRPVPKEAKRKRNGSRAQAH